jgi:hypothetical protein
MFQPMTGAENGTIDSVRNRPSEGLGGQASRVSVAVQRTTKMIAIASGKPMASAPAIVKLNAASRFTSGRNLSTDMLFSPKQETRQPSPGQKGVTDSPPAHLFRKVRRIS